MKRLKGWHELPQPTSTKKGIRNIAPEHYAVSKKKELETTLRQPLVMVDDSSEVRIIEKAIEAKNPIEQFQERRFVYQGAYTIIREVMQNSERIGRDRGRSVDVKMTFTPDSFTIEDNAGGVTKETIDTVFKLGASGYQHLSEETNPFGEGFISFILLFNKAEIISNDVNAEFDWGWIEEQYKKDPKFNMMKAYKVAEYKTDDKLGAKDKFIAKFTKALPKYDMDKAIGIAKEISKTIPVNSITINNELINNRIDFAATPPGYIKVEKKYGEKDGIIGYFHAGMEREYLRLFDNGAPVGSVSSEVVDNRYADLPALSGFVNIKHTFYGQANKARDAWINDDRIQRTESFIKDLAKETAINFVKYGSDSAVEKFQHFISVYTTFDDIKYAIHFSVIEPEIIEQITKTERALHEEMDENAFKQHMNEVLKSPSRLNDAVERAKGYVTHIDEKAYNEKQKQLLDERQKLQQEELEVGRKPEIRPGEPPAPGEEIERDGVEDKQDVIEEKLEDLEQEKTATEKKQKSVQEKIDEFLESRREGGLTFAKWKKETFWCERKDVEEYSDAIKMAGYYKVCVAIAENRFQREGFETFPNFRHLSELESSMMLIPTISHAGAKNTQERRIEFVIRVFLDAAGYRDVKLVIADIIAHRVLTIKGSQKKVDDEIDLIAYAEHSTNTIYLKRKISFGSADGHEDYFGVKALYPFLAYNDFSLENKSIGQGDIAVFSKIRKTLSHELAHLKFKTKDDTPDHFKAIISIDQKFDSALAEFKASSRISDSLTGLTKKAKERIGVVQGDPVVITVTKGAGGVVEKQEVPELRKTTLKDIYRRSDTGDLYSYKELIEKYTDIPSLQKAIIDGKYKYIGYKIGDHVLYKTSLEDERNGVIKQIGKYDKHYLTIVEDGGSVAGHSYLWGDIIKVLERKKAKYKQNEIFVREDGVAKTYKQIITYYDSGDFPIESGSWKQTGLKVGDRVELIGEDREAIIKSVEGGSLTLDDGGVPFHRDVLEVRKKGAVEHPVAREPEPMKEKPKEEVVEFIAPAEKPEPVEPTKEGKKKDQMSIEDLL